VSIPDIAADFLLRSLSGDTFLGHEADPPPQDQESVNFKAATKAAPKSGVSLYRALSFA
jgi:hypothetical protein